MRILSGLRCSAAVLAVMLIVSLPTLAQGLRARSGEVAGVFGWASLRGVDDARHVLFGASGGGNISQRAQIFGEYTYNPMGSYFGASAKLQSFGGGIRAHVGGGGAKANPFFVVAGGLARVSASASSITVSHSGGYFGAGGGVSLFLSKYFGVRPEARFERFQWPAFTMSGVTVAEGGGDNVFSIRGSFFVQAGGK